MEKNKQKEENREEKGKVNPNLNKQEWLRRSKKLYKRDKYGHIEGKDDLQDENPNNFLREEEKGKKKGNKTGEPTIGTKEWVNQNFGNQQSLRSDKDIRKTSKEK